MISAAAFFFVFFRPKEYPGVLSIGKLSLGFDAAVALISVAGMAISNSNDIGEAARNNLERLSIICGFTSFVVELALLLLLHIQGSGFRRKVSSQKADVESMGDEIAQSPKPRTPEGSSEEN